MKIIAYMICLFAAGWLVLEDLHFRKVIRDDLAIAQWRMSEFDPNSPGAHGKFMSSYYEDIYRHLPDMIFPALLVCAGASALLLLKGQTKTEQRFANIGITGVKPSAESRVTSSIPTGKVHMLLTPDEALVLFEFLSRYSETDELRLEDQAEQRTLWNLCCLLEKDLAEPFSSDYARQLRSARDRLRDK